jgi:hypothetical protein
VIKDKPNVCISLATSDTASVAHKALQVKYHWLREHIQSGELVLCKVGT